MKLVKNLAESLNFICCVQFWRMAFLWTLSLIFSYFDLFSQRFLCSNFRIYPRCSLKDSTLSTSSVGKPVCIITGATSGLGAAAAHALSKEGFYVVLVGRSSEQLSRAISAVKSRNKDACLKAFEVDLSSFKSIFQFKHSLEQWLLDSKMHSSVQLLINNVGILATSRCWLLIILLYFVLLNSYFLFSKIALFPLVWSTLRLSLIEMCVACRLTGTLYLGRVLRNRNPILMPKFTSILNLHRQVGLMGKSQHLSVVAVDPGAVKTNIMREIPSWLSNMAFMGLKLLGLLQSSETGVGPVVDAALAPPEVSGVYFFGGNGRCLDSSKLSHKSRLAKDLWATSCSIFQELSLNSRSR